MMTAFCLPGCWVVEVILLNSAMSPGSLQGSAPFLPMPKLAAEAATMTTKLRIFRWDSRWLDSDESMHRALLESAFPRGFTKNARENTREFKLEPEKGVKIRNDRSLNLKLLLCTLNLLMDGQFDVQFVGI